ncbi:MAG: hypothetical protein ACJ8EY_08820, partial [Sphingomicrobium sp.]
MRKLLITIATAASALAVAAPASAQYYPQQRSYNNGYGYNYGYGRQDLASFNANRLAQLRGQIRQYAMQGIISRGAAQRLEQQALQLNQQLRYTSRNG